MFSPGLRNTRRIKKYHRGQRKHQNASTRAWYPCSARLKLPQASRRHPERVPRHVRAERLQDELVAGPPVLRRGVPGRHGDRGGEQLGRVLENGTRRREGEEEVWCCCPRLSLLLCAGRFQKWTLGMSLSLCFVYVCIISVSTLCSELQPR